MSHHYVNQLIHIVWSTHNQQQIIPKHIIADLYAYISAILKAKNGKVFAISGPSDHIHLCTLLPPDISLSTLIGHVKACSSKWIKSKENIDPNFSWQNGYLAISTQEDRLDGVCSYIRSEETRHQTKSYAGELLLMLKQQKIEINEKYYLQNSHSRIYVHAIWSTNNRIPYLKKEIRLLMYEQMKEVINSSRGFVHAIGGVEDHVHVFMEMPKNIPLSDLIRDVKTKVTHWLKENDKARCRDFEWQAGYGAFTMSQSSVEGVKRYIEKQEDHHHKQTPEEEWNEFLKKCGYLIPR